MVRSTWADDDSSFQDTENASDLGVLSLLTSDWDTSEPSADEILETQIEKTLTYADDAIVRQHEIDAARAWITDTGVDEQWKDELWDVIHSDTPNQDDLVRLCASIRQVSEMREGISGRTCNLRWNATYRAEYELYVTLGEVDRYWHHYLHVLEFGKVRPFTGSGFVLPFQTPQFIAMAKRLQAGKNKAESSSSPLSKLSIPCSTKLTNRLAAYAKTFESLGEGERNNRAFNHAGNLWGYEDEFGNGPTWDDVVFEMRQWNLSNNPPLSDAELLKAIDSSRKNGTPRAKKAPSEDYRQNDILRIDFDSMNTSKAETVKATGSESNLSKNDLSKSNPVQVISLADLVARHPERREVMIEGLLRRGETLNIIASPKVGKTWLTAGLVFAVSNGTEWLGLSCKQGRVLVVDCELHGEELAWRYGRVAVALSLSLNGIDLLPLRGTGVTIDRLSAAIEMASSLGCDLIVLDALYRLLPDGSNENDNFKMMEVYNVIDRIAKHTGASVVVVHHSSKGDQSTKGVTDVGAGAGSISRAADSHLTLRPHELANCAVVEAVTRSFPSPRPLTIRFDFPVWSATHIEPKVKQSRPDHRSKQDAETKEAVLKALSGGGWLSTYDIRTKTGFGESRIVRALSVLLCDQVETKQVRNKRTKQISTKYKAKS
ncbi:MAG: AAA family ATPase [Pirellula sp.]|jgi:hypothetical protein